jgi:hypothetical protein
LGTPATRKSGSAIVLPAEDVLEFTPFLVIIVVIVAGGQSASAARPRRPWQGGRGRTDPAALTAGLASPDNPAEGRLQKSTEFELPAWLLEHLDMCSFACKVRSASDPELTGESPPSPH